MRRLQSKNWSVLTYRRDNNYCLKSGCSSSKRFILTCLVIHFLAFNYYCIFFSAEFASCKESIIFVHTLKKKTLRHFFHFWFWGKYIDTDLPIESKFSRVEMLFWVNPLYWGNWNSAKINKLINFRPYLLFSSCTIRKIINKQHNKICRSIAWLSQIVLFRFNENKAYQLRVGNLSFLVYCHLSGTNLGPCGAGGWTLVMKIDGSKVMWLTLKFFIEWMVSS